MTTTAELRRGRVHAGLVDEALIAVAWLVLYGMALQTGVAPLLAIPVSRVAAPLARVLGTNLVGLTALLVPLVSWAAVRLVYRVLGTGSPAGQTPGKRTTGLRVERTADGRPPGYRAALVREAVLLLEVLTVVGLAPALARRPWHDAAAGTRVAVLPERAGDARR